MSSHSHLSITFFLSFISLSKVLSNFFFAIETLLCLDISLFTCLYFSQVSGISNEIFRQIETVENDHDATTAAALEAVERRGEMVVRLLDPRHLGRAAVDVDKRYLALQVTNNN